MQTDYKPSLGASWQAINAQEVNLGGLGIATLAMNSGNKDNLAPLRLIAAAPDLLAALQALVHRCKREGLGNTYAAEVFNAEKIINRVKGE